MVAPAGPGPILWGLGASLACLVTGLAIRPNREALVWIALGAIVSAAIAKPTKRFWRSIAVFCSVPFFLALLLHRDFRGLSSGSAPAIDALLLSTRALATVLALRAVAVGLRHPMLARTSRRWLPSEYLEATKTAAEALPRAIANVPPLGAWRQPTTAVATMIASLDAGGPRVIMLTGASGAGKTTMLEALARELSGHGERVRGVLQPALPDRSGYDVQDLYDGTRSPLLREDLEPANCAVGRFALLESEIPSRALASDRLSEADVVIIDEVGPLELRGEGYAWALVQAIQLGVPGTVIAVRPSLIDAVIKEFGITPVIVDVNDAAATSQLRNALSYEPDWE